MRKLLLIINPVSGTGSKAGVAEHIEERVRQAGFEIRTEYTTCAGDATRLAQKAIDQGYYGVLACGGDGTVNETARALCNTDVALGIVPAGSGNGLARHIEIPIDVDGSLDVILSDHVAACDYGTVNGRPFFCTFGVGFDAAVSDYFARQSRRGLLTYLQSAVHEFMCYDSERYVIEIDGREFTREAFLVVCCNASQYGNNAFIAPDASIRDGVLDITIVRAGNRLQKARVGFDMMAGFIGRNALVETVRASHAVIKRQAAGPAHIDGEPVTLGSCLDVDCHSGRLHIFTNPNKTSFKPLITPMRMILNDQAHSLRRFRLGLKNRFNNSD
ncbi:MAG: diacylglycerol kinase family lipid kinase [Muribaculaceae bacterium]|nr:diacylglycerol kinase family lipid kinase [Muribaculaceae bacterium]